jgi:hypothetical protein
MKGKPPKNNTKCKNELVKKEVLLVSHFGVHPQKKE